MDVNEWQEPGKKSSYGFQFADDQSDTLYQNLAMWEL